MEDKELLDADRSGMDYIVIMGSAGSREVTMRCYNLGIAELVIGPFRAIYRRTPKGWVEV